MDRCLVDLRQTKQHSKQKPEIGIHKIVLIGNQTDIAFRHNKHEGIPKENKTKREPRRTPQTSGDFPSGEGNGEAKKNPKKKPKNAKFDDQLAVTILNFHMHRRSVQDARDILDAQGSCPRAIAVRPQGMLEGQKKILQRIVLHAICKFARRTSWG